MGTLRFFEEVVSFKIRRTFGFADYKRSFEIVPEAFFTRLPAVRAECCGSRARQCSIRQSQQEYSAEDECARIGEAGYGCLPICPETTDVLGGL